MEEIRGADVMRSSLTVNDVRKAVSSPITAMSIARRRLFPFGIVPRDPEAYRIGSWSYGKIDRVPITEVFKGIECVEVTIKNAFDRDQYSPLQDSIDLQELFIICSILKFASSKNILEIGTYDGNTTLNLAVNSGPDAKITTIDLPLDWNGEYELKVPDIYKNATPRSTVGRQYKEYKEYETKINQVYTDSAKLDWNKIPSPFDFVMIDGCHHYNYVRTDTNNALQHVTNGGIIVWHDYGMIKDVSEVVDDVCKSKVVHAIRGTRLAVCLK
jgi:hypothetical protein